ncbi:MAG: cobalamin-dependent protein [Methanobacteriaceae archaeon]|nr:cobalamin-dependent protein [Methanobacteriaceae archaeon]MDZ4170521.1 cobalamin-dependent protein [Methanobacteriaceae archaeon]
MILKKWEKFDKVLLIEPNFPIPNKSLNHKDFLPIGLLKLASYLKNEGVEIQLNRLDDTFQSNIDQFNFQPDTIFITSLFTYWSEYVKNAVNFCRLKFPNSKVVVGGIYASLMPDHCKEYTGCDEVFVGICEKAEKFQPDYSLVDVDYQIIHASRGCIRKCACCGVYEIEPEFKFKKSIKSEVFSRKIVFYDNNLLANPYIKDILLELVELKKRRTILNCESQSGFDGRILLKHPDLGILLKKANFVNPKIAWDGPVSDSDDIKRQVDILVNSGYKSKEISVFMLYNHDLSFEEMEKKRIFCWEWNVQISDCRYRPLDQTYDNYNPYTKKPQSNEDYYIHPQWDDKLIRTFRSNIRKQNICIRQDTLFYSADIERKRVSKTIAAKCKKMKFNDAKIHIKDAWDPDVIHYEINDAKIAK